MTGRVAVLGAGLVGRTIARDLSADRRLRVLAVDRDPGNLAVLEGIETRTEDLSRAARISALVADVDAVAVAVPGFLGTSVVRAVLEAGKPLVDISFSPEDPFRLDGAARAAGVPAVVDCGVAPGLSNLFLGRSAAELDTVDSARILVGGLPVQRVWPWEYRIVFSPTDVIEEYTRPSRYRLHGREVVAPALSDVERIDIPGVGTLEAFDTDGLRTLLRTVKADTLREKTLRYPGHAERIRVLRDSGFLSETPVRVGGAEVVPRRLTEALLFNAWRPRPGEEELTVLRVEVEGRAADGRPLRHEWDLLDRTDRESGTTSMARTTGFPCAIVVRLLLEGAWSEPGIHPPEHLGRDAGLTGRVLEELERRGVRVVRREHPPEAP